MLFTILWRVPPPDYSNTKKCFQIHTASCQVFRKPHQLLLDEYIDILDNFFPLQMSNIKVISELHLFCLNFAREHLSCDTMDCCNSVPMWKTDPPRTHKQEVYLQYFVDTIKCRGAFFSRTRGIYKVSAQH